jgi:hypothetical protein
LNAANNAYKQKVQAWQEASNAYDQALAKQKEMRDKYVDAATNTIKPGYDYTVAREIVVVADKKVQEAYDLLELARREKDDAYNRAAAEFKAAMLHQYGGSGGAGSGGGSPSPAPSAPAPRSNVEHACAHC